jgi:hypothetical protein
MCSSDLSAPRWYLYGIDLHGSVTSARHYHAADLIFIGLSSEAMALLGDNRAHARWRRGLVCPWSTAAAQHCLT